MRFYVVALALSVVFIGIFSGCSGSKAVEAPAAAASNRDAALSHYLNGGLLDQKEEYAAAVLEYQDALQYDQDPSIYYSIAKDYAILGKQNLAIKNAAEAVKRNPENREYHDLLAEIYLRSFQFDDALREYKETIRVDSTYREGWFSAGRILQLTKPAEALSFYSKYNDYFGPDFDIYTQMAQIYGSMGKTDSVIITLKEMTRLEPENFDVNKILADTYLEADSIDSALKMYKDLLVVQPDNIFLRASLAHIYLMKKDEPAAVDQIESVMKRDSISTDDQIQFGQSFVSFVQKDSSVVPLARDLFLSIKKSHPKDWRPYWFLGAIANIMHDDSTAVGYFEEVTRLASWNVDGWVAVASIYYDSEKFDRAIEVLEKAKETLPKEFRIYFILGISYQREKKDPEAAAALEQAIQLNTKNADAFSALALVYDEMRRHEDSDTMYERALRIDPRNALILNNYGYSLSERDLQLERALKMSEEAVRQFPENQSYLDTKGWIYFRLGRYEEAEIAIKRAVDLGSKSPVINEHLGDVYAKMHNKEKAIEYWQKALEFGSTNSALKEKIQRGSL